MGKHQLRLLKFLIRFPGWHTYGHDRSTVDAVRGLVRLDLVEVGPNRLVRLKVQS